MRQVNKSYRVDETYIKIGGESKYLYRPVDSAEQTIDFLLTARRGSWCGRPVDTLLRGVPRRRDPRGKSADTSPPHR